MVIKDPLKRGIPHNNDKPALKPDKADLNFCKGDFKHDEIINEAFSGLKRKFNWTPKSTTFVTNFLKQSFNKAFKKECPPQSLCTLCKHSIGSIYKNSSTSDLEVTHRFQDCYVEFVNSKTSMPKREKSEKLGDPEEHHCDDERPKKFICKKREGHCGPTEFRHCDERPENCMCRNASADRMWHMQFKRWWGWNYGRKRDRYKRNKQHCWLPTDAEDSHCIFLDNREHDYPHLRYKHFRRPSTFFHKLCFCCGYYDRNSEENCNIPFHHRRPRKNRYRPHYGYYDTNGEEDIPVHHYKRRNYAHPQHYGYYGRISEEDSNIPFHHPRPHKQHYGDPIPCENEYGYFYRPTSRCDDYIANKHLRQAWMKNSSSTITNCSLCCDAGIPSNRFPHSDGEYLSNRMYNIGYECDPEDDCCCCCPCKKPTNTAGAQTTTQKCITKCHDVQTEPQIFKPRKCCKCCRGGCKKCLKNCPPTYRCQPQFSKNARGVIPERELTFGKSGVPVQKTKIYKCCSTQHELSDMPCCSNILFSHVKTSPTFLDPIFSDPIAGLRFKNSTASPTKHFIQPPPVLDDKGKMKNFNFIMQESSSDVIDNLSAAQNSNQNKGMQNLTLNYPQDDLQVHIDTLAKCKTLTDKKPESNASHLLKASIELKNAVFNYKPKTTLSTYNFLATQKYTKPCSSKQPSPIVDHSILSKLVGQVNMCDSLLQNTRICSDAEQKCVIKDGTQPIITQARVTESTTTVGDSQMSSEVTESEIEQPIVQEIPLAGKKKQSKTYLKLKKIIGFNQKKSKLASDEDTINKEQNLWADKKPKINESNLVKSSRVVKNNMCSCKPASTFLEKYTALSDKNLEMQESDLIISSRVVKNVMDDYKKLAIDINSEINGTNLFKASSVVERVMDNYKLTSNFLKVCKDLSDVNLKINEGDLTDSFKTSRMPKNVMDDAELLAEINQKINESNLSPKMVKNMMDNYKQTDFPTPTSDFSGSSNLQTVQQLSTPDEMITKIKYLEEE